MQPIEYCVSIRTLGTAGEKYQKELDSLLVQTWKPKKILVYIAENYPLPKETIGIEEYIVCKKGIVMQRSLDWKEIDTEYALFLDDDMELAPDAVERMFKGLIENNGDCIATDVFGNYKSSPLRKVAMFMHSYSLPHFDQNWNIKMRRSGGYSYNNHPNRDILPTQSAPFPCFLIKMPAYHAIHFEDERWLDTLKGNSFEDRSVFYKLHIMGYKVLSYFNSGVEHLDARAGGRPDPTKKMYLQKKVLFVEWYRVFYDLKHISGWNKFRNLMAYILRFILGFFFMLIETVVYRKLNYIPDYFKALNDGLKFVHSEEYKRIPKYDEYIK